MGENSYTEDTTESTEKMITTDLDEKFEIMLDIIKVHTPQNIGD